MHLLTYRREEKQMTISEHLKQPTVVCKDLNGLIEDILPKRKKEEANSLVVGGRVGGGVGSKYLPVDPRHQRPAS